MPVPYTFGTATAAIPLSQLDSNFSTAITIGNTAVYLGNTTTSIGNLSLANVTISSVSTPITAAQGGTGLTSITANSVMLGNATGSVLLVSPGTLGNVLVSTGTTWQSTAPASSGSVTSVSVTSANGFAGTVATPTSTPAITLTTSITGVLKGNGTAISAGTAGTDYVAPGTATTFTATQTFSGSTSVFGTSLLDSNETVNVVAAAPSATTNFYVQSGSVQYYTTSAANNWTLNIAFSSGTSMNTALATGQSVTFALVTTQGSTAYYNSAVTIDGTSVTPKWVGGAPTAGNASGLDVYRYAVIKTASATYTVLASLTQYK